jgi:AcrR family transcriptional regulator
VTVEERAKSEATRERILKAAEECFARYGYDGTGVAEICETAAVSKGALYHHFPSKQSIFVHLFEIWMRSFMNDMERIRDRAPSVPAALRSMARMTSVVFSTAAGRLPLFFEFLTKAAREPDIWQATTAPYHDFRRFFADLIRRGIREGSLAQTDPDQMGQVIVSFGAGLVMQGVFDPGGGDWVRVALQGMDLLMKGVVREETPQEGE